MEAGGFQIVEKYRAKTKMARSVWWDKDDNTEKGTLLIKSLFNKKVFDFPKPVEVIKKLVEMGTGKDDIILDFFAGSGTTAHAVMQLNAEDGGKRKWICAQIPEATDEASEAYKAGYRTIAEISKERIRRAGEKILKEEKEKLKSRAEPLDVGFKALRLAPSNYRRWHVLTDADDEVALKKQTKLFLDNPLTDKYDEESVVHEILLKEGFDLNSAVKKTKLGGLAVWEITDGERKLVVSFAKELSKKQIESLGLAASDTFVCFDSALDDTTKVNAARNLIVKVI
jgi:adenine-specific DNA-methyltransferase